MNKTKNVARVIICLAFVLAFVFALSSCETVERIFNKHEHNYTRVVTPPTCEEQGYTTHTCECGDSYVDGYIPVSHELVVHDAKEPTCTEAGNEEYFTCRKCSYTTYEAIAPIGHNYIEKVTRFPTTQHSGILSNICSECGDTTEREIEAVSITLPRVAEFIKSFVGMNEINIDAANTELIFIEELDGDGENKRYIAIDLTRFELSGNEDDIFAHITFELGIATVLDGEGEPVFGTEVLVDIFANGDEVSISVTEGEDLTESDVNLTEEFYGYIAERFGMTYEELAETYYLLEKTAEYLPMIESLLEWAANLELPEGEANVNSVAAILYNLLVDVDENGYYYLDIEGIVATLEDAKSMTVAKLIDSYFGKGTMTAIETFMLGLPMMKVKTLAKSVELFAESNDIDLDEVYALVNYVIYLSTGEDFNLEREIKVRYNKTVAQVIIELSNEGNEEITESEINAMALGLVSQIKSTLDMLKKYNVDQLYNLYTYEDANFDYSVTDEIISTLELIDSMLDAKWHYSTDGELDALEIGIAGMLSVGYDIVDGDATVSAEITLDGGKTVGFDGVITETGVTFTVTSAGNEFLKWNTVIEDGYLISSEFKLNALYVGALEGYDEEENLLNVITSSFTKDDTGAFEYSFILNMISEKTDESGEMTVGVYENAITFCAKYDGFNTLVCTMNGKVITIVSTEGDGSIELDVTVKEDDTVIADYDARVETTLDDAGMVSEATVTVVGTIEGAVVDIAAEYENDSFSLIYKLDGAEIVNLLLSVSEDGNVTADVNLDGVNVTTEIITYVKEIIEIVENFGVLEELGQGSDLGQYLPPLEV